MIPHVGGKVRGVRSEVEQELIVIPAKAGMTQEDLASRLTGNHDRLAQTNRAGLTDLPCLRTSKWTCGPVERPLEPILAIA